MIKHNGDLCGVDAASIELGYSDCYVRGLVRQGKLKATMISGVWVFSYKDLQKFKDKRKSK